MLKVNEIFYAIQGESSYTGLPCVFIRLTGCNLRCTYCDTTYAYKSGKAMTVEKIIQQIRSLDCSLVEITGGEPLLQEETPRLAHTLSQEGFRVLVETNGTQNIDLLRDNIVRIVDIKTPGSGQSDKTDWKNLDRLDDQDEVKFVLTSRSDYDWAKQIIRRYRLNDTAQLLLSPAHGKLSPTELARWILEDRLSVRLQLQLHKILWPEQERGK